jgi:class 3 adenylate cyclase
MVSLDRTSDVPGDTDSTSPPQERPLSPPVPHGTVTFVFTDIEGSTELLKRLGDGYAGVVAEHRRILREEFSIRNGVEMDTQGDAFFFSFGRAREAVAAAVAAQRQLASHTWPNGTMLRVRMSLHTGEPVVGEEGYVGIDVVRAARICAAGHGGQVLLSSATAALVGTGLPEGVRERDLGAHRLKDIDEPERIYQLDVDGLPSTFPPLRTHGEDPIDFDQRLEKRIKSYVESRVEQALGSPDGMPSDLPGGMTKLALGGLLIAFLGVCLLGVIVVGIVLLVRFAF